MSESPFLLVSLDEDKAKTLAQVLTNSTAKKILEYLSTCEKATTTQIAKELDVALSTVHYNMELLVKSDLVDGKEFSYSEKGREMVHYKLSNKYVIIAPRKKEGILEKLKQFLPVFLGLSVVSSIIYTWNAYKPVHSVSYLSQNSIEESAKMAPEVAGAFADAAAMPVQEVITSGQSEPSVSLWFFLGGMCCIVLFAFMKVYYDSKK